MGGFFLPDGRGVLRRAVALWDQAHLAENLASLDVELGDEDAAALDALDENHPYYWRPEPSVLTLG